VFLIGKKLEIEVIPSERAGRMEACAKRKAKRRLEG
jgi:hypothetical protein